MRRNQLIVQAGLHDHFAEKFVAHIAEPKSMLCRERLQRYRDAYALCRALGGLN